MDGSTDIDKLLHTDSPHDDNEPFTQSNLWDNTSIHADQDTATHTQQCSLEIFVPNKRSVIINNCISKFTTGSILVRDELLHTGESLFLCEICDKRFDKAAYLRKHKLRHKHKLLAHSTLKDVKSLPRANLRFSTSFKNIDHDIHRQPYSQEIIDSNNRPGIINQCNTGFTPLSVLIRNELVHTGEHEFVCGKCSKVFTKASYLRKHELRHSDERKFVCQTCNKSFVVWGSLHTHELIHAEHRFICGTCGRKFTQTANLHRHELIHTIVRRFICNICNKRFAVESDLRSHEQIHENTTSEYRFICLTCARRFNNLSGLARHELSHTGERPFVCMICQNSFVCPSHLRRHELIHTGVRSYVCMICDKSFLRSSHLRRHEQTHLRQRLSVYQPQDEQITEECVTWVNRLIICILF